MTIRQRRNFLIYVVFPVGTLSLGLLGTLHWSFLVMAVILTIVVGKYVAGMNCPKCGIPVGLHKHIIRKFEFEILSPFTKKACEHCGKRFDVDEC